MTQQIANNTTMTTADTARMRETVMSLGKQTGEPFEQLAMGYMHVANFGFKGAEATRILTEATKSSVATGASAEDTANILANTLHEFGLKASDAAKAMNVLHDASALGNTTLQQFDASASAALGVAANFKVPLTDAAAAMTALTQHGYDAARAATQVQDMMAHIAAPTPAAVKALEYLDKTYGTTLVKDFSASGLAAKGLHGIFDELHSVLGDNASAVMSLIAAQRGGFGAMTLLGTGAKDYAADLRRLNDDMSGKIDPTQKAFNATMGTADRKLKILKQSIETELIPAGMKLIPVLTSMLPMFKDLADDAVSVISAFASLPEPVQKAIIMFGAGAAISKTLGINFGGLSGAALKLIGAGGEGGFTGVKIAGSEVLGAFTSITAESTGVVAGLGLIGAAAAGAALDIYLIARDAKVAQEALELLSKARDQDAATAAGYAGLNKTGDSKRNMIGEAANIAKEEGEIKSAIAGRTAALNQYSGGFNFDNQLRLKAQRDITGLKASLASQEANRKALLSNADKLSYTSHSAPYNAMKDAATDRATAAAANAGPAKAGGASRDSIMAGMKAEAAQEKEAAKAAKEAAAERKREAAEAARDAQQRAEQAKNFIGDMREEIALYGNESREAKLLYDIQHGGADYLDTAAKRQAALSLARQLDTKKETAAEKDRLSGFLSPNKDQADGYRETIALGVNATDQQRLAYEHLHTVIDTLSDADQRFIQRAWKGAEVLAGRAQATTLAADALESYAQLQQKYADDTTTTLGTVKTAAQEAALEIAKALQPSQKLGISIGSPTLTAAQQGVMSAAIGTDTAHAAEIAKKWLTDLNGEVDTAREKVAGTYDPATKAVDAWLKTNKDAIQQMTALIGNDKALAIVNAMKQSVASMGNLDHANELLGNYKSKVAEIQKQYQELSASSPYDAWKNSILEYDKATGTLGEPFGENDLKNLYNYQEKLKDVQDVAKGLTDALFTSVGSAFQPQQGKQQEQDYANNLQQQQYSLQVQAANFNTSSGIPNPYTAELNSVDQRLDATNAKLKGMGVSIQNVFRSIFTGIISEFDNLVGTIAQNAIKAQLQQGLTSILTHAIGSPLGGAASDPNAKLVTAEQASLIGLQANTNRMGDLISALQQAAQASATAAGTQSSGASSTGGIGGFLGTLGGLAGLIPGLGSIAPLLGVANTVAGVAAGGSGIGAGGAASSASGLYTPSSGGSYTTADGQFTTSGVSFGGGSTAPTQNFTFNVQSANPASFIQSTGQMAQAAGASATRYQQRNGK